MSHQIAYANAWVLRVDGAQRRLASYVALPIAVGVVLLAMIGGAKLYTITGAAFASSLILDRAYLYLCILLPFYAAAAAMLAFEKRAGTPANAPAAVAAPTGFLVGALGFVLAVGVTALIGGIAKGAPPAPLDHRLLGMGLGVVFIGFQSFGEEFFFRGWLQPLLAARLGPWIGITITSVLFVVAHAITKGLGPVAIVNDMLASIDFGLLAFRSGGLLAPFAAHFAWNWLEQCVTGLTPNPGVDPLGSLFDLDLVGGPLVSGGADEMNGALCATLALIVMGGAILAWRPTRKAL